jgi:AcrR family transcriptional regulator
MMEENIISIDPKERILTIASDLFAKYGYSAVGVRDIAKDADVNISMISYYFNGKIGILKAIIERYFEDMGKIVKEVKELNLESEEHLKILIKKIVKMLKEKTNLCKAAIMEISIELKEVREFKNELLDKHLNLVKSSFPKANHFSDDKVLNSIIGPAFISLVFSHFLVGNTVKDYYKIELDDEYYDKYAEVISTLYLKGIHGIKKDELKNKHIKENK